MTRRLNAPYFGKRYVGDSETKILHDVDREKAECKVEEIPKKRIQMFEWLSVAEGLNYAGCRFCMPDLKPKSS